MSSSKSTKVLLEPRGEAAVSPALATPVGGHFIFVSDPPVDSKEESKDSAAAVACSRSFAHPLEAVLSSDLADLRRKGKIRFIKAERARVRSTSRTGRMSMNISIPPPFEATMTLRHRFYFLVEASPSVSAVITDRMIRGACGGICTAANSKVMPWASTIKVNAVDVWPPASTAAGTTADVYWVSTGTEFVKDEEKYRVVPEGVTVTGRMRFTPPPQMLISDWIADAGAATGVFGVVLLNGTVVVLDVSFTLSNNFVGVTNTVGVGTLSSIYYLALDGPSSNKIVPQGVPTTA